MKFNKWTILLTAAIALASMPAKADPQSASNVSVTNLLAFTNSTAVTGIGDQFPIVQNAQMFILPTWVNPGTNGVGTATATMGYNFSPDGSIWTTTLPFTNIVVLISNAVTTPSFLVSPTNFTGYRFGRLDQVTVAGVTNASLTNLVIGAKNISTASY